LSIGEGELELRTSSWRFLSFSLRSIFPSFEPGLSLIE
jgi:hypothetical protein